MLVMFSAEVDEVLNVNVTLGFVVSRMAWRVELTK